MRGPRSWPAPATAMVIPISIGRVSGGPASAMMLSAPLTMPLLPMPATARPTMNIGEETAVAQRREPSSKTATKIMKEYFIGKNV